MFWCNSNIWICVPRKNSIFFACWSKFDYKILTLNLELNMCGRCGEVSHTNTHKNFFFFFTFISMQCVEGQTENKCDEKFSVKLCLACDNVYCSIFILHGICNVHQFFTLTDRNKKKIQTQTALAIFFFSKLILLSYNCIWKKKTKKTIKS